MASEFKKLTRALDVGGSPLERVDPTGVVLDTAAAAMLFLAGLSRGTGPWLSRGFSRRMQLGWSEGRRAQPEATPF
jgi:hypothetical protein